MFRYLGGQSGILCNLAVLEFLYPRNSSFYFLILPRLKKRQVCTTLFLLGAVLPQACLSRIWPLPLRSASFNPLPLHPGWGCFIQLPFGWQNNGTTLRGTAEFKWLGITSTPRDEKSCLLHGCCYSNNFSGWYTDPFISHVSYLFVWSKGAIHYHYSTHLLWFWYEVWQLFLLLLQRLGPTQCFVRGPCMWCVCKDFIGP